MLAPGFDNDAQVGQPVGKPLRERADDGDSVVAAAPVADHHFVRTTSLISQRVEQPLDTRLFVVDRSND